MKTTQKNIRILLVDDHKMLLHSLKEAIDQELDLGVVALAENGREAVKLAQKYDPDIIIMDISMPELNGIEAVRKIIKEKPQQKILTLSMHADKHYIIGMLRAGVSGYVLKTNAFEELACAIRQVAEGNFYVSPEITGVVIDTAINDANSSDTEEKEKELSSREVEVLQFIAEGKDNSYMADKMGISKRTVEIHRQNLRKKLGIDTVAELTRYAVKRGIVSL
ncbi:MAG: DNA-binding response regulator [Acidobacteria bacterium]|nr:MAG: DNA-binding response regulator [Acidobacteriota bacterium]